MHISVTEAQLRSVGGITDLRAAKNPVVADIHKASSNVFYPKTGVFSLGITLKSHQSPAQQYFEAVHFVASEGRVKISLTSIPQSSNLTLSFSDKGFVDIH